MSRAQNAAQVQGTTDANTTATGYPVRIGGVDGTGKIQDILVAAGGGMTVDTELPPASTYGDGTFDTAVTPYPMIGAMVYAMGTGGATTVNRVRGHDGSLDDRGTSTTGLVASSYLYGYDSAAGNWDRVRTTGSNNQGLLRVAPSISSGFADGVTLNTWALPADETGAGRPLAAIGPIFNGTTWDRPRSANSAAGTAGTGVPAAGMMGFDGTNWQRLQPVAGVQANAWNNAASGAGGTSNSIDVQFCDQVSIFGHVSGATTLTVQLSQDNSNFYDSGFTNAPAGAADFGFTIQSGARYARLKSSNNVTITATITGKT